MPPTPGVSATSEHHLYTPKTLVLLSNPWKRQTEHVAPQIFSRTVLARLRAFRNPDTYDKKEAYQLSNSKNKSMHFRALPSGQQCIWEIHQRTCLWPANFLTVAC